MKQYVEIITLVIFSLLLFSHLANNKLESADHEKLLTFQRDSESFVIGKINSIAMKGFVAENNFLGRTAGDEYYNFLNAEPSPAYTPYLSQIGVQGFIYALIAQGLERCGWSRSATLAFLRTLTCGLLTLILLLFTLSMAHYFGVLAAVFLGVVLLSAEWLVYFASNLYWVLWLDFLAPALAWYGFMRFARGQDFPVKRVMAGVFFASFAKAGSGYEFISTTMMMTLIAGIFFTLLHFQQRVRWLKFTFLTGLSALGGFILALLLHLYLLTLHHSSEFAFNTINQIVLTRSYYNDFYAATHHSLWSLLGDSLEWTPIRIGKFAEISFRSWLWILLAVGLLLSAMSVFFAHRLGQEYVRKGRALLAITAASSLAPLSWFVLAKGHSAIHMIFLYILWYLPFCLFAAALMGFTLRGVIKIGGISCERHSLKFAFLLLGIISAGWLWFSQAQRYSYTHQLCPGGGALSQALAASRTPHLEAVVLLTTSNAAEECDSRSMLTTALELPVYQQHSPDLARDLFKPGQRLLLAYQRRFFTCNAPHLSSLTSYEDLDFCLPSSDQLGTVIAPSSPRDLAAHLLPQFAYPSRKNPKTLLELSLLLNKLKSQLPENQLSYAPLMTALRAGWNQEIKTHSQNQPVSVLLHSARRKILIAIIEKSLFTKASQHKEGQAVILNGERISTISTFSFLADAPFVIGEIWIGDSLASTVKESNHLQYLDFSDALLSKEEVPLVAL